MNRTFIISLLLLASSAGQAQDSVRHVVAKARLYADSVVLRWGPTNATDWERGNKYGYRIERVAFTLAQVQTPETTVQLTNIPIRPYTIEQWRQAYSRTDTLAGVAVSLLYTKLADAKKGAPVNLAESIDQHYMRENRFSYTMLLADWYPHLGKGLGLRLTDKTAKPGQNYLYRVILNGDGKQLKPDTALALTMGSAVYKPTEFLPVGLRVGERVVILSWNRLMAGNEYSAYWVERSDDGGNTFRRLHRQPYIQPVEGDRTDPKAEITYTDSIPRTYRPYRYRVQGISAFGDRSLYSTVVTAVGRDKTPPDAPTAVTVVNTGLNQVRIDWQKPVREPDLAGYVVGKSNKFNGPFTPLHEKPLPVSTLTFTDAKADPNQPTYYLVVAVDTAGNAGRTSAVLAIIDDNVPPAKPTRLTGTISRAGVMRVAWQPGPEPDLLGYMVYYANAADHRFVPLTTGILTDTVFVDSVTVNTLTSQVFVKIVAFDRHENASDFSAILAITRPDVVPPTAPVFNQFSVSDSAVTMTWAGSQNTDLANQLVYRRLASPTDTATTWQLLATLGPEAGNYVDRSVARQQVYEYSIVSRDAAGLTSAYSFPLRVRTYDRGYKPPIATFKIQAVGDKRMIDITYQYTQPGVSRFALYRSFGNSGLQLLTTIPASQYQFSDRTARSKGDYEYSLKAFFTDGTESPMTARQKITLD